MDILTPCLADALPLPGAAHGSWDDLDDEPESDPAPEPLPDAPELAPEPAAATADDATLSALIARMVRQDDKALQALYDATAKRVHGLVLRITGNRASAEEAVEDTFWQAWRQAPRFDAERGRPLTWLLAIARSRAIDVLRREQRFKHDEMPDDDTLAEAGPATATAQDLLAATQSHQALHGALALLSARERQLVSLAFFRGLTHEEIAEQQALALGTVKSLIRRALLQLKRHLEGSHVQA